VHVICVQSIGVQEQQSYIYIYVYIYMYIYVYINICAYATCICGKHACAHHMCTYIHEFLLLSSIEGLCLVVGALSIAPKFGPCSTCLGFVKNVGALFNTLQLGLSLPGTWMCPHLNSSVKLV